MTHAHVTHSCDTHTHVAHTHVHANISHTHMSHANMSQTHVTHTHSLSHSFDTHTAPAEFLAAAYESAPLPTVAVCFKSTWEKIAHWGTQVGCHVTKSYHHTHFLTDDDSMLAPQERIFLISCG